MLLAPDAKDPDTPKGKVVEAKLFSREAAVNSVKSADAAGE
jgi:hypothetical protein